VDGGSVDPVVFSGAEHDWIVAALDRLGLASHQQYRVRRDAGQAWRIVSLRPAALSRARNVSAIGFRNGRENGYPMSRASG
jgi:hypothetical protein